jgi:hypothetical protein
VLGYFFCRQTGLLKGTSREADITMNPNYSLWMKKLIVALAAVLIVLGFLLLLRQAGSSHTTTGYTITMQLSGSPGAAFTGEYFQDGKRVAFSGALPWTLTESNISRLEIRKARMEDTLVLDAQGGGSRVSAPSGPDSKGIRLKTEGGWSVEFLR